MLEGGEIGKAKEIQSHLLINEHRQDDTDKRTVINNVDPNVLFLSFLVA